MALLAAHLARHITMSMASLTRSPASVTLIVAATAATSAATTTVAAPTTMAIATAVARVPVDIVNRWYLIKGVVGLASHLVVQHVGEHITDGVRRDRRGDAGHQRIKLRATTSHEVRDELFILHWLADGGEGVREVFHLVEVVGDGGILLLLHGGELHPDLHDPCTRRRGEVVLQRVPHLPRRLGADNVAHRVLGERGEEGTQNHLILMVPVCVLQVDGDPSWTVVFIGLNDDGLAWSRDRAFDVAHEPLAPEVRHYLHRP